MVRRMRRSGLLAGLHPAARALVLCAAVAGVGGCGAGPRLGARAPELALQDLDGRPWSLSGERGHVVVLDVWATWCPPCRASLPGVDAFAGRRADDGVRVVAVSIDADPDAARTWLRDALPRRTLRVVSDPRSAVMDRLRVRVLPALYVVDATGRLRWTGSGDSTDTLAELDRAVADALGTR